VPKVLTEWLYDGAAYRGYPLKLRVLEACPSSEEGICFLRFQVMDSCFPPLSALSLRDHKSNGHQPGSKRHGRPASTQQPPGDPDNYGKIEILQDLDLYYIRQIAHNLQVV
jgi:hypothetical protein